MADKDVSIVESTVPLMDPAGETFQAMLKQSQEAAVAKLAKTPDTSMTEAEPDKPDKPEAAKKEVDEPDEDEPDKEEIPGDDIGNLKRKVSGLQAELTRTRKQKSGSAEEVALLRERMADTEGQLKVLRENKTTSTIEDKLSKLTDDQLADNKIAWEDEHVDARLVARLAEKENDPTAIKEANARIAAARQALKLYENEGKRRDKAEAASGANAKDEQAGMATEIETLFTDLYTAAPDLQDKTSTIWKAGQKEYSALPRLTKALGPLGELIAVATAIAKNPQLIGKKVISAETGKVLEAIEKGADKAFQKGGAAPSVSFKPVTSINSQADLSSFEEQVRNIKRG
jgi:hypothetical protein